MFIRFVLAMALGATILVIPGITAFTTWEEADEKPARFDQNLSVRHQSSLTAWSSQTFCQDPYIVLRDDLHLQFPAGPLHDYYPKREAMFLHLGLCISMASESQSFDGFRMVWDAVRIQAKNQDGAWACALIVLKPDADNLDVLPSGGDDNVSASGNIADATADTKVSVELAIARLRGIWYDSGDTFDTAVRTANGADHCSPVEYKATQTGTDAPLPGAADEWTIVSGTRVLHRNV